MIFDFGADRDCFEKDLEPSFCFVFVKFQNRGSGLDGAAATTMRDFMGIELEVGSWRRYDLSHVDGL